MVNPGEFDMKRNLIINYLPPTLSQDDVKQMFARVGSVTNCKLVRNNVTGQSLGYAFIEYPTEQLAAEAISQIDGIQMQGKTIKVSYARQSSPDIKNSNVYIAGLPNWVSEDELLSLFSPFGSVLSHKVLKNQDGTFRGAGFVRYALNSEATKAIESMAGKTLRDSSGPLTVKLAIPPASKQDSMQALSNITTNTLAGIGVATRSANVRFNPMAPSNQLLIAHQTTNATPAAAVAAALSGINAQNGQGVGLQVSSVYVYGLQATHTELTLYELFAPFGAILNVKLMRDNTKDDKPCKGFGFVNFTKYEDAYKAVTSMNGVPFEDKILQVSFKQNKMQLPQAPQVPVHPTSNMGIGNGAGVYSTVGGGMAMGQHTNHAAMTLQ